MIIRTLIIAFLTIPAFFLSMRHNIHMFQLNGYKNGEHFNWLKKNLRQQWLLIWGLAIGVLRIFLPYLILDVIIIFTLLLIVLVYNALKRLNTKKKLVYTARVKRLITTDIVVVAVIILLGIQVGIKSLAGFFLLIISIQLIADVIANIINHPIETIINQYYINDAKKRLRAIPDLKIIGVTGSYGKTSIKFYLETLLREKYNVLVTPESFNTPMGIVRTIRESLKPSHEIFVCEMGARYVGEIKEICDIVHPNHGIITSVGPQHLETFLNIENIKNTKFELADALPEEGILFLNGDNEYIMEKAPAYKNKIFYYSEKSGNGFCVTDVSLSQEGTEFTVVSPSGEREKFQIKLIGMHNIINVVGAIAVANTFGIDLKDLKVPARRIRPVEHRMQMREQGAVTIIDDAYNSNPIGSKAAVETLAMFNGIRILITPGMVELGEKEAEFNYRFGTYAAECCDYILLVGKKHTEPIRQGILSKGFSEKKCLVYDKIEDALSCAYSIRDQGHKYILLENDLPDNY